MRKNLRMAIFKKFIHLTIVYTLYAYKCSSHKLFHRTMNAIGEIQKTKTKTKK